MSDHIYSLNEWIHASYGTFLYKFRVYRSKDSIESFFEDIALESIILYSASARYMRFNNELSGLTNFGGYCKCGKKLLRYLGGSDELSGDCL